MSANKAPTPGLWRNESRVGSDDSGAHTPSSGAGGAGWFAAPSGALRRPSSDTLTDDWGADAIYAVHDGLEPDELDVEVEFEDEWRDGWTTWDRVVIGISCACTVIALAGLIFGWWW